MPLQNKLYKEILQKKVELENVRKQGINVNAEWDLPCIAVGCKYSQIEYCGFSNHSRHLKRPDIIRPFDSLLCSELLKQAPHHIPKLPYVLFKNKRVAVYDSHTGKKRYKRVVDKFIGTCAEDNASNCVLYHLTPGTKPPSLKDLVFTHPVRTRTLKREKMCNVCNNLFTEPSCTV